jgi:xanthine dehydrogenase YagR molybdenum-binding subunit
VPAIDIPRGAREDPRINEIGARGRGEIGMTDVSAAVAHSVFPATGRRVRNLPLTLDKILKET